MKKTKSSRRKAQIVKTRNPQKPQKPTKNILDAIKDNDMNTLIDIVYPTDEDYLSERIRVQRECQTIMAFMESRSSPDFALGAMIVAIERACTIHHIDPPDWDSYRDPDYSKAAAVLKELFAKTAMYTESPRERLAFAIEEILNNDESPERLYRKVGEFVCDIQNHLNHDGAPRILEALQLGCCGYIGCPGALPDGSVCPGPESEHHKSAEAGAQSGPDGTPPNPEHNPETQQRRKENGIMQPDDNTHRQAAELTEDDALWEALENDDDEALLEILYPETNQTEGSAE